MSTLLVRIDPGPNPGPGGAKQPAEQHVSLDVGRTLAITLVGIVLVVGAIVLFALHDSTSATTVLGFAEAVIFGGLGIAVGEARALKSEAAS